jgi:hypothetical protein
MPSCTPQPGTAPALHSTADACATWAAAGSPLRWTVQDDLHHSMCQVGQSQGDMLLFLPYTATLATETPPSELTRLLHTFMSSLSTVSSCHRPGPSPCARSRDTRVVRGQLQ